jgi:sulfonate transport system ATP-binding protein
VMSPTLANIKREFIVNIPRPRKIDHPLIESIIKEIVAESADLFPSTSPEVNDDSIKEHNFITTVAMH